MTAEVETFATKEEWLKRRLTGIGSSDAPIILGLTKWKSPLALYHEKLGLRTPSEGEIDHLEFGLAMEPVIIATYERRTGRKTLSSLETLVDKPMPANRWTSVQDPELPFLLATPDAGIAPIDKLAPVNEYGKEIVEPPVFYKPGVLEAKNVDVSKGRDWEDTQEAPIMYTVQVQHQLMVTGLEWGSIAAVVGGNRFMWADIRRDEELIRMLRQLEIEFWDRVVRQDPPPVDGSDSTKELLKRLYPKDTGELIDLPDEATEWDEELEKAKRDEKDAKARRQLLENKLTAAIGSATVGVHEGVVYSWKWQKRRAYQAAETEYRVLRRHGSLQALER